jgi:cysteinyl-tRNA synthetase
MNITDVADRVYDRAKTLNRNPEALARAFEGVFKEDMMSLNVRIDSFERASDHIPEVIAQIQGLIDKGFAYETKTGVYFEVNKFPKFGALSGLGHEELSLRRLELCSSKKNPEDFSLWRKETAKPTWNSLWGTGRPGWHVEDTAIAMQKFGETYDIHGGASELMFPHHEAEIAQAEALTGKIPFVRFWLHTGLLRIHGRKMSKSLGNVIRIRDALKKYSPHELRWFFASYHYREPVTMTESAFNRTKQEYRRVSRNMERFRSRNSTRKTSSKRLNQLIDRIQKEFKKCMNDDFNTPKVLNSLITCSEELAKLPDSSIDARSQQRAETVFRQLLDVLGIAL